jgi:hypothetical protein
MTHHAAGFTVAEWAAALTGGCNNFVTSRTR